MGHVINPISQRLGYSRFWSSNWSLSKSGSKAAYSYTNLEGSMLLAYFRSFLKRMNYRFFEYGFLVLYTQVMRFFDLVVFNVCYYSSFIRVLFFYLKKALKAVKRPKKTKTDIKLFSNKKTPNITNKFKKKITKKVFSKIHHLSENKNSNKVKTVDPKETQQRNSKAAPFLYSNISGKRFSFSPRQTFQQKNKFNKRLSTTSSNFKRTRLNISTKVDNKRAAYSFLKKKHSKLLSYKSSLRKFSKFTKKSLKLRNFFINPANPLAYVWGSLFFNLNFFKILKKLRLKKRIIHSHRTKKRILANRSKISNTRVLMKYLLITFWFNRIKNLVIVGVQRFLPFLRVELLFTINHESGISASFISKYVSTRLLRGYPMWQVFKNVVKQLKIGIRCGWINGFKISCNGRFARRGRATHLWKIAGLNPKSDVSTRVDYSMMLPVLTNSICAVKVWVTKARTDIKALIL